MTCIRCRVTLEGQRYLINTDGKVQPVTHVTINDQRQRVHHYGDVVPEEQAKLVRREAARQRTNRNRRERDEALRSIGLVKTAYGWE